MRECICSSCKNLKGIIDENGAIEEYECEFGFPSDNCSDCEVEECELACTHYESDEDETESIIVRCHLCGKELKQFDSDTNEGRIYCVDCFLNN